VLPIIRKYPKRIVFLIYLAEGGISFASKGAKHYSVKEGGKNPIHKKRA